MARLHARSLTTALLLTAMAAAYASACRGCGRRDGLVSRCRA
jgi:hypothetical protein